MSDRGGPADMVKYDKNYRSQRTEYRGAASGRSRLPGGTLGKGAAGAGGLAGIIILIITMLTGGGGGLGGLSQLDAGSAQPPAASGENIPRNALLEFTFDHTQQVFADIFAAAEQEYRPADFVIFDSAVATGGCGNASADVGPFYCPADSKVYLDQGFFDVLAQRFGAPGDFAAAYVVAHEMGHHVQNVLGLNAATRDAQQRDPRNANQYSINLELQADCLAGVWAYVASRDTVLIDGVEEDIIETGDIAEGLEAAAAVGDDRIQASAGGSVNPETWTHGSSEQRVEEFNVGYTTGDATQCDTVTFD